MKTFKQFLIEVERSAERALKLVDRLQKHSKFNAGTLGKYYINPKEEHPQIKTLVKPLTSSERAGSHSTTIEDVPIKDIYTTQSTISSHVLKKKINNISNQHLPSLYYINGRYKVDDGNHTISAHRALGKLTVKAKVMRPRVE